MNLEITIQQKETQLKELVNMVNQIETQRRDLDIKRDELIKQILPITGAIQQLKDLIKDNNSKKEEELSGAIEVVPPNEGGSVSHKEQDIKIVNKERQC